MIILIITILLLILILRTLQIAYFSPLSAFPNAHFLAPLTPLWLLWIKATKREIRLRNTLHERLGPVVRLGPRELSINDAAGVKMVYGGGFDKNEFFEAFVNFGENVMFSTISPKAHTERKRMLSHLYSKSNIQSSTNLTQILSTLTSTLKTELLFSESKTIDIYKLTKSYGMDTTTAYLFGLGYGTNFIQESRSNDPLEIFEIGLSPDVVFYSTAIPKLVKWAGKVGWKFVPDEVAVAWAAVEGVCFQLCENAQTAMDLQVPEKSTDEEKRGADSGDYPMTVYAQLYRKLQSSNPTFPKDKIDRQAAAEMLDHMLAGNEGSGITLSYLVSHLSNHPEIQLRLRNEIRDLLRLETNGSGLSLAQDIDALPIVDAVLQETMRLHPAAFGPFPRVVPSKHAQMNGNTIPPGTVVSTSAYSLQRNADVFPEPGEWKPERWIGISEEQRREMGRWFWVFGSGGRMCVGNHLAIRVLKAFVVAVYSEFESVAIEGEMPEQEDGMMGIPDGNKVFAKFRKIDTQV